MNIFGPHLPNKYKVKQKLLTTTLENSNLLSNIYFSNYAKWIGQLSDEYFYQCLPDFYSDYYGRKEIFCSHCSIDYTNECFPFDRILIEMFIGRVFEKGIEMYFEFHKVKDDKKVQKLAYAKQQILFVSILDRELTALNTPDKLIKLIKELRT
jgi:acyl-CoA thioesterase FadM